MYFNFENHFFVLNCAYHVNWLAFEKVKLSGSFFRRSLCDITCFIIHIWGPFYISQHVRLFNLAFTLRYLANFYKSNKEESLWTGVKRPVERLHLRMISVIILRLVCSWPCVTGYLLDSRPNALCVISRNDSFQASQFGYNDTS